MNFDIVESVVDFIEDNFNREITNECTEKITQKSHGYVRNEFKKIVNMSLDKYRIRRQLSIIIKKIKESGSDLNKYNLEPWSGENSFYKAFVNEFKISPMKFIKEYDEDILQQKFNVEQQRAKFNEDCELIESIIRIHGNKNKALMYLLTLKPYKIDVIGFIFVSSEVDLEYILIQNKYATCIGQRFFAGKVPDEFYRNHSKILNRYYDLNRKVSIKQHSNKGVITPLAGYIITKRSVINKLIEEIDIINMLGKEIAPSTLRTLWYEQLKAEHLNEDIVAMPNELIGANISIMKHEVIRNILFQEQGHKVFNTMEDLRRETKFNYDKPIDNQVELCIKCKYRLACGNEDDCKYFEELSKEEQDNILSKPDYEPLSTEKLLDEIKKLLSEGLLYFDTNVIEK